MSANRMKLRFGTKGTSVGATISLSTPLTPGAVDEAVESLSKELINLANNKETLKRILESFAKESYEEYLSNIEKLYK